VRLRVIVILGLIVSIVLAAAAPGIARDKPYSSATLKAEKLLKPSELVEPAITGQTAGSGFNKNKIIGYRCETGTGNPAAYVDISCAEAPDEFGDFGPDNELAIAVDPLDGDHLLAGSNDYFYRFNSATGARQALVPTGFFTSFDGGVTWVDGQIPLRTGNGGGDPAPAFNAAFPTDGRSLALMAQLENVGGNGGPYVSQGDVSVSRSTDGGITWSVPVTVMKGTGTGIGPANRAVFWDKEWIAVDNNPSSDFFGRIYVTATRFLNGLQGSYAESPIYLSFSDDGGLTWSTPAEISGSNPTYCTYQETGPTAECDEDQDSNPVVAPDGTVYVYFLNSQNEAAWEGSFDFDGQIMVVKSTDGGASFAAPVPAAQVEDGGYDMPYSVLGRQTIWGHQIRWASFGNMAIDPSDADHLVVTWSDRGAPNLAATDGCYYTIPRTAANNYDPCGAGPGAVVSIYKAESMDGGATWGPRTAVYSTGNHQWFPWAGFKSDGTLVVAFDHDTTPAPADTFQHVLVVGGAAPIVLGPLENIDVSATHWAGQYTTAWPTICGPAGPTAGKDCNAFHGDYTGLAVGPDNRVHVVWTGLNALVTTPQIDFYTGSFHQGYRQDAMYAQR